MKEFRLVEELRSVMMEFLRHIGISVNQSDLSDRFLAFTLIVGLAILSYGLLAAILLPLFDHLVKSKGDKLIAVFLNKRLLRKVIALIPPLILLLLLAVAFPGEFDQINAILRTACYIYLLFVIGIIVNTTTDGYFNYYVQRIPRIAIPYRPLFQMVRIVVWIIVLLFVVSILTHIRLLHIITGLSAFIAILIIIFRNTLLGFVASFQLLYNKMISVGDWIAVPGSDANGIITDINILTVRIQNFDNTYVYVPAYNLVSNPFKNWSGMYESGVWQVTDSYVIDVTSIQTADIDFVGKLLQDSFLKESLPATVLESFRTELEDLTSSPFATNLKVFRRWSELYLLNRKDITPQPYMLIFEQGTEGTGISLHLMFFIKTTDWLTGYTTKSDILEIMANAMDHFNLRQFQYWTKEDFVKQG